MQQSQHHDYTRPPRRSTKEQPSKGSCVVSLLEYSNSVFANIRSFYTMRSSYAGFTFATCRSILSNVLILRARISFETIHSADQTLPWGSKLSLIGPFPSAVLEHYLIGWCCALNPVQPHMACSTRTQASDPTPHSAALCDYQTATPIRVALRLCHGP